MRVEFKIPTLTSVRSCSLSCVITKEESNLRATKRVLFLAAKFRTELDERSRTWQAVESTKLSW